MALEGTHLRFALDLKERYKVKDLQRYLSGTIYPDSRYVTGIDRVLTHPEDWSDWHLKEDDDFKKGWFVHLLADKLQYEVTKELLPSVFAGERGQGSEVWIKHSAIKILLDLDDIQHFDIKSYLPCLEYIKNPNGEDLKKIKEYNNIFIKMYANPDRLNIESGCEMWKALGASEELLKVIKEQTEKYDQDVLLKPIIGQIYDEMLKRAL